MVFDPLNGVVDVFQLVIRENDVDLLVTGLTGRDSFRFLVFGLQVVSREVFFRDFTFAERTFLHLHHSPGK